MRHMVSSKKMTQSGVTLIELLAALAIMGMIMSIIYSVFIFGIQQGEKTKSAVNLQQEANYIANMLRHAQLNQSNYTISINNNQIILNGSVISDKYQYDAMINYNNQSYKNPIQNLTIQTDMPVTIEIKISNSSSSYTLKTTLSRGV